LESKDKEKLLEKLSKKEKVDIRPKTLPQLLEKIEGIDKNIKRWSGEIHKVVTEKFLLTPKFYYYPN